MPRVLIQHPSLPASAVAAFARALGRDPVERGPGHACWQIPIDQQQLDLLESLRSEWRVDVHPLPDGLRLQNFGLAAFDMDSTLITIECVDEIAEFAGCKAEVARITEAAMRGEIADYDESLRQRVALLAGLPESVLERVYEERLRITPGAERLIQGLQRAGLKTLLVSGGFTFFTSRLQSRLGLDHVRANTLEVSAQGRLTGRLLGEIVNARIKRHTVEETCRAMGLSPRQCLVVGDGANDLEMMSVAGLSVAYRAKPLVRRQTHQAIDYCGLDAILNFFDGELQPPSTISP